MSFSLVDAFILSRANLVLFLFSYVEDQDLEISSHIHDPVEELCHDTESII